MGLLNEMMGLLIAHTSVLCIVRIRTGANFECLLGVIILLQLHIFVCDRFLLLSVFDEWNMDTNISQSITFERKHLTTYYKQLISQSTMGGKHMIYMVR